MDRLLNLVFQEVRGQSATVAALQLLPELIFGVAPSSVMGFVIRQHRGHYILIVSIILSCFSAILLATVDLSLTYWMQEFPAVLLTSSSADVLYVAANILITSTFPRQQRGLATAIFNTIAQLGRSFGITTTSLIASYVTAHLKSIDQQRTNISNSMRGYRAAAWYCLGLYSFSLLVLVCRLRSFQSQLNSHIDIELTNTH